MIASYATSIRQQTLWLHVQAETSAFGETGPPYSSYSGPMKCCEFYSDLCRALISAHIPLHKVNNPVLRKFLIQYMNLDPPVESTLR